MTEVNITPEQPTETQAEIDALVAKAEGKETPAVEPKAEAEGTPERPEWLPAEFETPEDMAKAYAAQKANANEDGEASPADADKAAEGIVEAAGLDMNELGQKINANGDLDEADYEALAKQGVSKEMVQQYVAGQQAVAEKLVADLHAQVGGKEKFDGLIEWAAENLSKDEIEAFNTTVDTASPAAVKLALSGLQSRQVSAMGSTPNLVGGKRGTGESADVFRSRSEMTAAMADPRYGSDPAYRADVVAKLGRSKIM